MAKTEIDINFNVDTTPDKDGTEIDIKNATTLKSGKELKELIDIVPKKTDIFLM